MFDCVCCLCIHIAILTDIIVFMCIVSDLIFQYLLKHCSHVKLVVLGCEHKATEMMPNQLLELTWNCMTAQKCLQNAPVLRGRS